MFVGPPPFLTRGTKMGWKIWYDNGKSYKGKTEKEWNDLAKHGVLIIVEEKEDAGKKYTLKHQGLDYYWFEDGQILSCSRSDLDRYLERDKGVSSMKFGRWANDYTWNKCNNSK